MKKAPKSAGPYGLPILESCLNCVLREDGLFCRLPSDTLKDLNNIRHTSFYPNEAVLFVEGQESRGLFILCAGKAKLVTGSEAGKELILRVVETGEVLALSSVMANTPYQSSAVTMVPSEVSFISRTDFLRFLKNHAEVAARVGEHLGMELHKAWEHTRLLALAPSATAKLAQLLLARGEQEGRSTPEGISFSLRMTQQEIGDSIGSSRETVSRLLAQLQRKRIVKVQGNSMLLLEQEKLRSIANAQ